MLLFLCVVCDFSDLAALHVYLMESLWKHQPSAQWSPMVLQPKFTFGPKIIFPIQYMATVKEMAVLYGVHTQPYRIQYVRARIRGVILDWDVLLKTSPNCCFMSYLAHYCTTQVNTILEMIWCAWHFTPHSISLKIHPLPIHNPQFIYEQGCANVFGHAGSFGACLGIDIVVTQQTQDQSGFSLWLSFKKKWVNLKSKLKLK